MLYDMSKTGKYLNPFWITLTIAFCILFIVLFTPIALEKLGILWGVLAILAGVMVILLVYLIRVKIFTGMKKEK